MLPLQPAPSSLPSGSFGRRASPAGRRASWQRLLWAPHRLGFAAGTVAMVLAALWWAAVLAARHAGLALPWQVNPNTAHALFMTQGFMPLFIVGFLFTAGPRWLGVAELPARTLLLPVVLMGAGWALALAGFHTSRSLAGLGLAVAAVGWALATGLFGLLVLDSRAADRRHATWAVLGCGVLAVALWAAAVALVLNQDALVRALTVASLWGGLGAVFATVLHRMLPFFTASALPQLAGRRPRFSVGAMVGLLLLQGLLSGWDVAVPGAWPAAWALPRALLTAAAGLALLWQAWSWGLWASRAQRLLLVLHLGFAWLGLALLLDGLSQALGWARGGPPAWGQAPLHALTMGFLVSTLLAMATRVACGHSGRPLRLDAWGWQLFWVLQLAVLLRLAAAVWPASAAGLQLLAVQFWLAALAAWALRHGPWLLQARVDGGRG